MNNRLQISDIEALVERIDDLKRALDNTIKPAEQIVYDDVELRSFLKVSKRTTAYWREKGIITFSKLGGKIYYKLSDILNMLKQNETPAIISTLGSL